MWSFFLKSLGVLVLRFQRHDQEYKIPFNLHHRRTRDPIGLMLTTSVLFFVAIANLFSKQIATIYGIAFHDCCCSSCSPFRNTSMRADRRTTARGWSNSIWMSSPTITARREFGARPGCVLVAVRDYNRHVRT